MKGITANQGEEQTQKINLATEMLRVVVIQCSLPLWVDNVFIALETQLRRLGLLDQHLFLPF